MKAFHTAAALDGLRHVEVDIALSIQNGPGKNELLGNVFGTHVLGATANTSGELRPNGEVLFTRNEGIMLGELSGVDSQRGQALARKLDDTGVRAGTTREIVSLEWSKFCAWTGLMAVSVLSRANTWKYACDPTWATLVAQLVREMTTLAQRLGVELTNDSILPVRAMSQGNDGDATAAVMQWGKDLKEKAPEHRMSTLQDLEAGRPLELEETIGYALRKAEALDVRLPLLERLYGPLSEASAVRPDEGIGESAKEIGTALARDG
jgi:2-dehydropantoate 2-reductase